MQPSLFGCKQDKLHQTSNWPEPQLLTCVSIAINSPLCASLFWPVWPPWSLQLPLLLSPTDWMPTRRHAFTPTSRSLALKWHSTLRSVYYPAPQFANSMQLWHAYGKWLTRHVYTGPIRWLIRCRFRRDRARRENCPGWHQGATGRLRFHCSEHRRVFVLLQQ